MSDKILVGADPEFFVYRTGHVVSAHIFEDFGTKTVPRPTKHGSIQVDGVALECNVTPASTRDDFLKNCFGVVHDLRTLLKERDGACDIRPEASVYFGQKKLEELPPQVAALGCSPDYNAYTLKANPRPDAKLEFRTASGHVHIGWTSGANPRDRNHMKLCAEYAKQLDYYLGLPSLIWDRDSRRRGLYGQAGAFRPKPYGMEYRTLSAAWLRAPALAGFVFDRTKAAITDFNKGEILFDRFGLLAQNWINTGTSTWPKIESYLGKKLLARELNDDIPF